MKASHKQAQYQKHYNTVPPTEFVSKCEECLHFEVRHVMFIDGAISCQTCGLCYRPEQKAVFLTREQYLRKYPKSCYADDIRNHEWMW